MRLVVMVLQPSTFDALRKSIRFSVSAAMFLSSCRLRRPVSTESDRRASIDPLCEACRDKGARAAVCNLARDGTLQSHVFFQYANHAHGLCYFVGGFDCAHCLHLLENGVQALIECRWLAVLSLKFSIDRSWIQEVMWANFCNA
jgi:hypothetical protein